MDLGKLVQLLNEYAPLKLAESWDNVGLLVEPSPPHIVTTLLLTNDLTEEVVREAIEAKANAILSYHPPIFSPLKRITQASWKERIIVTCLEHRIAVYSPHTSFDAVEGGNNDWLLSPFDLASTEVICGTEEKTSKFTEIKFVTNDLEVKKCVEESEGYIVSHTRSFLPAGEHFVEALIPSPNLRKVLQQLSANAVHILHVNAGTETTSAQTGCGRLGVLKTPVTVEEAVQRYKSLLGISALSLSMPCGQTKGERLISRIAVCAGAGGSVLKRLAPGSTDLAVTGEMAHNVVLDLRAGGCAVILAGHSNTERGFLAARLKGWLEERAGHSMKIVVSAVDADPFQTC